MTGDRIDWIGALGALALLVVIPLIFGSSYIIGAMTVALGYGMSAASWDFMSGLTGRENFGHSLFIGAGAYTAGFLDVNFGLSPWWSLLAAPLVAVLFGILMGFPTLRLRGPYFALAMLSGSAVMQNPPLIFFVYPRRPDRSNRPPPPLHFPLAPYHPT